MPDTLSPSELAMLDALGEATPEQRETLRGACERDSGLAAEHRRLVGEVRLMDAASGPEGEVVTSDRMLAMPSAMSQKLQAERRTALETARAAKASQNVVRLPTGAAARADYEKAGRESGVVRPAVRTWPRRLAIAAGLLILGGISAFWIFHPGGGRPAALVLSPGPLTGLTRPALVWENAPGKLYNVWILPPDGPVENVPALFVANDVTSPVAFSELKAKGPTATLEEGRDYRLLVCLAGTQRLGGVAVPFRVAAHANAHSAFAKPQTPEAALHEMQRTADAGRPGDALGLFATLPADLQNNAEIAALQKQLREEVRASRAH